MAKRIQRKRVKGWRMPSGAVSVCRPGRYGNPFIVEGINPIYKGIVADRSEAVMLFQSSRHFMNYPSDEEIKAHLRGFDLACWCPLDEPCHADVLLRIANS